MKTIKSELSKADMSLTDIAWNENDAIFERMIIKIPYKSPDLVKRIEETFERVNL